MQLWMVGTVDSALYRVILLHTVVAVHGSASECSPTLQ